MDDHDGRLVESTKSARLMGGTVTITLAHERNERGEAESDIARSFARIEAWARRLTRFDPDSDLSRLNRDPRVSRFSVGPTLASVLGAAFQLQQVSGGALDVGMLGARLAAPYGSVDDLDQSKGRWWLVRRGRGVIVCREGAVLFDLDGIAKGWIADRALRFLGRYPAALVDADGDIAMRGAGHVGWEVAVADPHRQDQDVATLALGVQVPEQIVGIATSGTTRHRWPGPGAPRHHLIDPSTRRPARGDIAQATVVASSAVLAEALAKVAVIREPLEAGRVLDAAAAGVVLVDARGVVRTMGRLALRPSP